VTPNDASPDPKAMFAKQDRKSRFFFLRRRPKFWGIPREWTAPPTKAQYEKQLEEEGFLTESMLPQLVSESLKTDLRELQEHLLPHFWRKDQEARFFQNRRYLFQWLFTLSAFFTTAFSAISVLLYAEDWETATLTGILGAIAAAISGIATAVAYLDANQSPLKRWFQARAQAENLRSLYFLYLARQQPFNIEKDRGRVHKLRQQVLEVLQEATQRRPQ
jgi:hypothetical protein